MDLLLHLVKQQEVDIHEVSIAQVLQQYLRHLDVLKALDLVDLGDFVVMASTLMEMKSRELLPREEVDVSEELDTRDDLIRRLLEYKRYRDLSRRLERMMHRRGEMLSPVVSMPKELTQAAEAEEEEDLLDMDGVEIWMLTEAFSRLMEETGQSKVLHFDVARRTVRHYTEQILEKVRSQSEVEFNQLFDPAEGRYGLIGVFTAMLEMMKQGYLSAYQETSGDGILVAWRGNDSVTVEQILAGEDSFEELTEEQEGGSEGKAEHQAEA